MFKYSDAEIDSLLDSARAMQDQAARKTAYDKVQKKLACAGPIAHLAYGTLFTAMREQDAGLRHHAEPLARDACKHTTY